MQFHEKYMDKIHNHEVAGSIPAPATKEGSQNGCLLLFSLFCLQLGCDGLEVVAAGLQRDLRRRLSTS